MQCTNLALPLARLSSSDALLTAVVLTFPLEPYGEYRKIRSWLCVCVCVYTYRRECKCSEKRLQV